MVDWEMDGNDSSLTNKSEQISNTLKKAILAQRIAPGTKLGERELSEQFCASRIVIRQALLRLANQGLATIEQNRGAFVTKPSLHEAMGVYDTLTLIEQGVAIQHASRLDKAGWRALREHIELQTEAIERGDNRMADDLGAGFHALFISLTNNKLIQELHSQVVQRTHLLRSLYRSHFDYCNLLNEHSKIVDLLERGRVKQATDAIEIHHHHVVRGYVMELPELPKMTLGEALFPFLVKKEVRGSVIAENN